MSRNKSFLRDLKVEALVPAIIKVVLLLLLQALDLHHLILTTLTSNNNKHFEEFSEAAQGPHLCTQPLPHCLVLLISPYLSHYIGLWPVLDLESRHQIEQLVWSVKLGARKTLLFHFLSTQKCSIVTCSPFLLKKLTMFVQSLSRKSRPWKSDNNCKQ